MTGVRIQESGVRIYTQRNSQPEHNISRIYLKKSSSGLKMPIGGHLEANIFTFDPVFSPFWAIFDPQYRF
jgi:hypothetical protein